MDLESNSDEEGEQLEPVTLHALKKEILSSASDAEEEELPPILAPPSTGYLHNVDVNQPPPKLRPADNEGDDGEDTHGEAFQAGRRGLEGDLAEVVEVKDTDEEGSTTTDSEDDMVDVDYMKQPPEGFQKSLQKYAFASAKHTWIFSTKRFYKSQPTRIRRLLKMHKDADGNPIEEPIEMLFEKIHAERERMRRAQNIKCERGEDPDKDVGPASMVKFTVSKDDTKLTQILYPANVVNDEKAISTLGGIGTISKTLDQPNKKLVLKFRPNDPYCNGVSSQGRSTCGILLRVRRKKNSGVTSNSTEESKSVEETESKKIDLDSLGAEPATIDVVHDILLGNQLQKSARSGNTVMLNGKKFTQQDLQLEDQIIIEEKMRQNKTKKAWVSGDKNVADCSLKIPKILETVPDKSIEIHPLGVINRAYDFNGICDFQYLPMTKKQNGSYVSIKDKIFPIFGARDNPEKLVLKTLIGDGKAESRGCQPFSLPPVMSRIDHPPRGLLEELIVSEKVPKTAPPDESIISNRTKRIIYTLSYNFLVSSNEKRTEIPSQPLGLAIADIERRQIKKELVEIVRLKFEERAIWSKVALEYATKIPSQILKYIIPNFAYFASNGPWRNTWIKFGLDPRQNPSTVIYQSVDFRIPFVYRRHMQTLASNSIETAHRFLPDHLPSKAQMFYQLCDIKLNEIKELMETLKKRAASGTLTYDERHGFLKEGSFEYFRYIMTYYLENLLQDKGKIVGSGVSYVTFTIPPGAIEPPEKMKAAPHRRVKQKRIRKSVRKGDLRGRPFKGRGKQPEPGRSVQATRTLEDLELNKMRYLSDPEESFDEDDDDDDEDYTYA